jgi:hypothetical protein
MSATLSLLPAWPRGTRTIFGSFIWGASPQNQQCRDDQRAKPDDGPAEQRRVVIVGNDCPRAAQAGGRKMRNRTNCVKRIMECSLEAADQRNDAGAR